MHWNAPEECKLAMNQPRAKFGMSTIIHFFTPGLCFSLSLSQSLHISFPCRLFVPIHHCDVNYPYIFFFQNKRFYITLSRNRYTASKPIHRFPHFPYKNCLHIFPINLIRAFPFQGQKDSKWQRLFVFVVIIVVVFVYHHSFPRGKKIQIN